MLEEIYIFKIVLFIVLFFLSYEDIRYKKISLNILVMVFFCEMSIYIYLFVSKQYIDISSISLNIIFSFILFLLAKFSKEKIAYGDVIVLALIGFYMRKENFYMFISLLLLILGIISALIILINIFRAKYKKDVSIPMIPFILISMLFMEVMK